MRGRAPQWSRTPFAWRDTGTVLSELADRHPLEPDDRGWVANDDRGEVVRLRLPLVLRPPTVEPRDYAERVPDQLGAHLVVLMQAGAAALGTFDGGDVARHVVLKRYVTRGRGKAQPTYLASKGKSRFGSRLRLRNARALLDDVTERLDDWVAQDGAYERHLYSCPVRLWAELFATSPTPPIPRELFAKIPLDVRKPGFKELERAYRACRRGWVETRVDGETPGG